MTLRDSWLFWPFYDFRGKFVSQDRLGALTRDYTWSATQLTHAALGFGAAFLFLVNAEVWSQLSAIVADGGPSDAAGWLEAGLLTLFIALLFGGLVYFAVSFLRNADWRTYRAASTAAKGAKILWRVVMFGVLAVAAVGALLLLYDGFTGLGEPAPDGEPSPAQKLAAGGVALATVIYAAVIGSLSAHVALTALGWLALAAAAVMVDPTVLSAYDRMGMGGMGLPEWLGSLLGNLDFVLGITEAVFGFTVQHSRIALILVILFFVISLFLPKTVFRSGLLVRIPATLALTAAFWIVTSPLIPEGFHRVAASVLAALALWWVKEFATDVASVERAIQRAALMRTLNGYPARKNGVDPVADFRAAQEELRRDALCDSRTDAMFYLFGALFVIAAQAMTPVWTGLSSATAALAILLLAFLVYTIAGFRWTRRGRALDDIAVAPSSRFAVYEGALDAQLLGPDGAPAAAAPGVGSLETLRAFAKGELASPDGEPVRHLVIAGPYGSGRSRLAHTLACETALAEYPPCLTDGRASVRRGARLTQLRQVLTTAALEPAGAGDARAALSAFDTPRARRRRARADKARPAPAVTIVDNADPFALDAVEAFQRGRGVAAQTSATHSAERKEMLSAALTALEIGPGDQTVWVVGAPDLAPATTAADGDKRWAPPPSVRAYAQDLAECLSRRLGDGAPARIGLVIATSEIPLPLDLDAAEA